MYHSHRKRPLVKMLPLRCHLWGTAASTWCPLGKKSFMGPCWWQEPKNEPTPGATSLWISCSVTERSPLLKPVLSFSSLKQSILWIRKTDSQELILDLCGFIETFLCWILTEVELHVNITGTSFLRFQHLFLGPLYKIRQDIFPLPRGWPSVF